MTVLSCCSSNMHAWPLMTNSIRATHSFIFTTGAAHLGVIPGVPPAEVPLEIPVVLLLLLLLPSCIAQDWNCFTNKGQAQGSLLLCIEPLHDNGTELFAVVSMAKHHRGFVDAPTGGETPDLEAEGADQFGTSREGMLP